MRLDRLDVVAAAPHQKQHAEWLARGLKRHGVAARIVDTSGAAAAPVAACWGWRVGQRLRQRGHTVLVMERGYVGDRFRWTSLGWNGLNGRAVFPAIDDGGHRFEVHHAALRRPWREVRRSGLAVIMGQVRGDAAVQNVDFSRWAVAAAGTLARAGYEVRFRPHPGEKGPPPQIPVIDGDLDETLRRATLVVTWNSNSGVDAVLAGCPTIACDAGSMALPIAAAGLGADLQTPDRSDWAARIAWTQWLPEELSRGDFVEPVLAAMPN